MWDPKVNTFYRQKPSIIIPAYQPSNRLLELVKILREESPGQSIIVIDDGSQLAAQALFHSVRRCGVVVLKRSSNKGKGAALKMGFQYFLEHFSDSSPGVVTADADGQHMPNDILSISHSLANDEESLHLGIRQFNKEQIPMKSKLGNMFSSFIFRRLSGLDIDDVQTGLRGIPKRLVKIMLTNESMGYEFELDMLITTVKQKISIKTVPIETVYLDKNEGSHFKLFSDSLKIGLKFFRFFQKD